MRRGSTKLKSFIRYADLIDVPELDVNADPVIIIQPTESAIPYAGHEGEEVIVADGGEYIILQKKRKDIVCFYPGTPPNSQLILQFVFPERVKFIADLATSYASVGTAAGTSSQEFSFQKNAVEFATLTFGVAATTGTWAMASDTIFEKGDILKIVGPASVDAAIADLSFTLDGVKRVKGN